MPHDLRHAWRSLRARPAFALLSVLILALGIGAATAISTVAYAVWFKPLPYADPDGLVFLWDTTSERPLTNLTPGRLVDFDARMESFAGVTGIGHLSFTMTGRGLPERFPGASVSSNFFDSLGSSAALGRVFHEGERERRLVVLSHALWQRRFGADTGIVGSVLTLNGAPHTVVGVMPRTFYWTSITASPSLGPHPELWVIAPANDLPDLPVAYRGDLRLNRRIGYLRGMARLKPGATLAQAQAEALALSDRLARDHPDTDEGRRAVLIPARTQLLGHVRLPVLLLLGASALLLVAACTNVAHLQLMRLTARRRDLVLQAALGAGRGRLARQLLAESLLITAGGGLAGFAVGSAGLALLKRAVTMEIPRLEQAGVDLRALALACVVSALCGMAIAVLPVLRSWRHLAANTGDRSQTARISPGVRRALVAGELAVAAVLVVGALLFGRSLEQLRRVDVGIPGVDRLLTFNIVLSGARSELPPAQRVAFYDELVSRLRAMPGVRSAAVAATLPIGGDDFGASVIVERDPTGTPRAAGYQVVGTGWFTTLGVPLLAGRDFTAGDTGARGRVVMVNRAFADQHWPGLDPVGRRIRMGPTDPWMTVVGLVGNLRHLGPRRPPRAEVYEPHYQQSFSFTAVAVRTAGDPRRLIGEVRRAVAALDPTQPVSAVATMGEHLNRTQAEMQSLWSLTTVFGSLSMIVAALGVYGAIGFSVAQRMREFGVRLALGAAPLQVGRHVLIEALATAAAGVGAGLALAAAAARAVSNLLFDTPPTDPGTYAVTAVALVFVAILAACVPARRAMRADPAAVLRAE